MLMVICYEKAPLSARLCSVWFVFIYRVIRGFPKLFYRCVHRID